MIHTCTCKYAINIQCKETDVSSMELQKETKCTLGQKKYDYFK